MPFKLTKFGRRELGCEECDYLEGDTCTRNKCTRGNQIIEEYKFKKEFGDMRR